MGFIFDLLLGNILSSYFGIAIIITTIFVVWMLFISRFLEPVPFLNKIDTLLFIVVVIAWVFYFAKNIVDIILSNILYSLAIATILIIIIILIVKYKK